MSSHIRCRTAAEIARDGDFITKGCGVDEMATFMLCQRSIHVTCSTGHAGWNPSARLPCGLGRSRPKSSSKELAREVMDGSAVSVGPHAGMISKEVLQSLFPPGSAQKDTARTGAPGGSRLPRSKCMRGMARRVWLAGWASHRLELTATSPWIDSCTPVGKTRCRPGKSRSCDGQGRRSVVTDKAGDHVTQHDARPALACSAPTAPSARGLLAPVVSA